MWQPWTGVCLEVLWAPCSVFTPPAPKTSSFFLLFSGHYVVSPTVLRSLGSSLLYSACTAPLAACCSVLALPSAAWGSYFSLLNIKQRYIYPCAGGMCFCSKLLLQFLFFLCFSCCKTSQCFYKFSRSQSAKVCLTRVAVPEIVF